MTHTAAHFHIHRKTVPRFGTLLGVLALGLGVVTGAATPAAAECGTSPLLVVTGTPGETYTCKRNCSVTRPEGHFRITDATTVHRGDRATVRQCLEDCSRNRRCANVQAIASVSYDGGVATPVIVCDMYSAGDLTTEDAPPRPSGRFQGNRTLCFRNPTTPLRDLQLQLDTRLHQDQFRPSFPPGGSPANQYRGK